MVYSPFSPSAFLFFNGNNHGQAWIGCQWLDRSLHNFCGWIVHTNWMICSVQCLNSYLCQCSITRIINSSKLIESIDAQ
jgi:hypothetical protein